MSTGNRKSKVLPVASAISILFAPIGNRIAIAKWDNADSGDRSVGIWDSDDLREIDRLPLPEIERTPNVRIDEARLAFSRDSHYLALENQGLLHL